jgi:PAS domain S-box-containing protein
VESALDRTTPDDVNALESVARLMEVVGSNASLPAQLNNLALFVERLLDHIRCSIHLVNLETGTLHCGAAPNLPAVYTAAVEGVRFGEGIGSCGTAAARRALVIVTDTSKSPLWKDFQHLVRDHDLAACWSMPVLSGGGELLGTFAMYYREPHEPTAAELATLRVAAPLAAVVIERHRDTQRLRDSEERFRSAFDSASIGKALVGIDGQWLRVNQALCRLLGYSAEELLCGKFQALTHSDDLRSDLNFMREMLDGERTYYEMEKRYFHKSGHTIWALLSVSLVRSEQGQPLYFISQLQDITERKRLERALRELTSSEQQRWGRDLHDGLGQELTGLAFLAGAFATKVQRLDSPLARDALALADIARNAVATCRDIVRGVSPLTESQGGLVRSLRQLTRRAAELSGRNIRFTADERAPVALSWDARNQLFRITQEALDSAVLRSDSGNIDVNVVIDLDSLRIEVQDEGMSSSKGLDRGGPDLETIRYRAAALQARLSVNARPGGGAAVVCECPQSPASSAPETTLRTASRV